MTHRGGKSTQKRVEVDCMRQLTSHSFDCLPDCKAQCWYDQTVLSGSQSSQYFTGNCDSQIKVKYSEDMIDKRKCMQQ